MDTDSIDNSPDFLSSDGANLAFRTSINTAHTNEGRILEDLHIVFCGGFHSNMRGTKAVALEEICSKNSLSYTRFDYRGHGESDGAPSEYNLTDWLSDTLLILDTITTPILLVGSSMGGWLATLAATRRLNNVRGMLLIACAPDFVQELIEPRLSKSDLWDLQQGSTINLPNEYDQPHPLTQSLLDSAQSLSLFKHNPVADITCPIRLIHGTADTDVPYELSIRLMNEFKQVQAQLTLLHNANHRLSDDRSLKCMENELLMLVDEVRSQG